MCTYLYISFSLLVRRMSSTTELQIFQIQTCQGTQLTLSSVVSVLADASPPVFPVSVLVVSVSVFVVSVSVFVVSVSVSVFVLSPVEAVVAR